MRRSVQKVSFLDSGFSIVLLGIMSKEIFKRERGEREALVRGNERIIRLPLSFDLSNPMDGNRSSKALVTLFPWNFRTDSTF